MTLSKWEEGIRRHEAMVNERVMTDGVKRAVLTNMLPKELAEHATLNSHQYDSYDKLRAAVVNYCDMKLGADRAVGMHLDASGRHEADEDEDQEYFEYEEDWGDECVDAVGKGGHKGKGKGKGNNFDGECFWCGKKGHRKAQCEAYTKHLKEHGGKAKGKGKSKDNNRQRAFAVEGYGDYEAEALGGVDLCAVEKGDAKLVRGMSARLSYLSPDWPDMRYAIKEAVPCMANRLECDWGPLKNIGRYLLFRPRLLLQYGWQK